MDELRLTLAKTPLGLLARIQSEVEALALAETGTHHRIFLEPVPLLPGFHLVWNEFLLAWRLEAMDG